MILYTEAETQINLGGKYLRNFIQKLKNNDNPEDLKMVIDIFYNKLNSWNVEELLDELKETEEDFEKISNELSDLMDEIYNTKEWLKDEYTNFNQDLKSEELNDFVEDMLDRLTDMEY